jgi:hypothetical protein
LQAKIEATQEVKRVKEAMTRQVEKVAASLKKLEAAEQKAKDAADDLQAVVEGKFAWLLGIVSVPLLGLCLISTFNAFRRQGDEGCPQEGAHEGQGPGDDPQGEDCGGPAR